MLQISVAAASCNSVLKNVMQDFPLRKYTAKQNFAKSLYSIVDFKNAT